jgi:CheY-like chemotaxis protein
MGRHILFLEGSEDDTFLLNAALNRLVPPVTWSICGTAEEGKNYLAGKGTYSNRDKNPLPCAIFTEIILPGESGLEFIQWLRREKDFEDIPVIILTGGAPPKQIEAAHSLGVSRIVVKPMTLKLLQELLQKSCSEMFSQL